MSLSNSQTSKQKDSKIKTVDETTLVAKVLARTVLSNLSTEVDQRRAMQKMDKALLAINKIIFNEFKKAGLMEA